MSSTNNIVNKLKEISDKNPNNKSIKDLYTRYVKAIEVLDTYLHPKHTEASLKRLSKEKRRKLLIEHESGSKKALRTYKEVSKEVEEFFDTVLPNRTPQMFTQTSS